jgi:hypothetical protein
VAARHEEHSRLRPGIVFNFFILFYFLKHLKTLYKVSCTETGFTQFIRARQTNTCSVLLTMSKLKQSMFMMIETTGGRFTFPSHFCGFITCSRPPEFFRNRSLDDFLLPRRVLNAALIVLFIRFSGGQCNVPRCPQMNCICSVHWVTNQMVYESDTFEMKAVWIGGLVAFSIDLSS